MTITKKGLLNVVGATLFFACIGFYYLFGIVVLTPLADSTPVLLSSYGWIKGSTAQRHVATIPCIADDFETGIYIKDLAEFRAKDGPIHLSSDAEGTTLGEVKTIIRGNPENVAFDPGCVVHGYFKMKESRLGWQLIGWN